MTIDASPPGESGHPVAVKPPFSAPAETSAFLPEPRENPYPLAPADLSARIRRSMKTSRTKDPAVRLATQTELLDAIFTDLILNGASGPGFDERFGLAFALRAQKQCRQTVEALETLVHRRQKPKKDQNATNGLLSALLAGKGMPDA
jgi:hypothetical protein